MMTDYSELFKKSVDDFLKLLNENDFIKEFFVLLVDMIQFGVISNLQNLDQKKADGKSKV